MTLTLLPEKALKPNMTNGIDNRTAKFGLPGSFASSVSIALAAIATLTLPISTLQSIGASQLQIIEWITFVYGTTGAINLILSIYYKSPIIISWNVPTIIAIASVGKGQSLETLRGSLLVVGICISVVSFAGLGKLLCRWIPSGIVMGMLSGVLLNFVVTPFTALNDFLFPLGGALISYFISLRFLGSRASSILVGLISGISLALLTATIEVSKFSMAGPAFPSFDPPLFSFTSILSMGPLFLLLITLQANFPAVVLMKESGLKMSTKPLEVTTGILTALGSFFGITPMCLAAFLIAITNSEIKPMTSTNLKIFSGVLISLFFLMVALCAGLIVNSLAVISPTFTKALAGLSLFGVFQDTLSKVCKGPLMIGPIFAFIISASQINIFGLSGAFWAIPVGLLLTFVFESENYRQHRRQY